ncbi:hypothetical protein FHS95_002604 [Sphingomonas naasensis]|uniref:Baseplate protein J-like domain-containing protein n=1 Tax=Sphingomonas naasensis TaxID=1344951 RepID=A0A4V6RB31_9SPHN|nr:hypothetical protein [Sphingomonas naasensis]NIJ20912.1 hypothetical protein [Sphingomonas naasensis]TGX43302.1 hypothetical protein E5A74_09055 [Sphingomonas naasensis]
MTASSGSLITRWATQTRRSPAGFAAENALLDSRTLPDLLADIARLAADIPFHDDAGQPQGTWREILLADPSLALALLASAEVERRAERLDASLRAARQGGTPAACEALLTRLVAALLAFADDLDAWLGSPSADGVMQGQSVRRLAEGVVERVLSAELEQLFDGVSAAEEADLAERFRRSPDRRTAPWRPGWRSAMRRAEAFGIAVAVERAWSMAMLRELADAIEGFVDDLRERATAAAAAFEATLAADAHNPHPALVIAFARLFEHARALLNRVPQQLIDFYQLALLHAAPLPSRPDRMLLALAPKPGTRPRVASGTLVPAGKDAEGKPILFATETALEVTRAVLREARLWLSTPQGSRVTRLAAGPDGALGDPASGIAGPLAAENAAAHAIFSTPLLDLAGGARRIELELRFAGAIDPAAVDALQLSLSTATGWLPAPAIARAIDADLLTLALTLPPGFPALAPCPPETADAVPHPALRLALASGWPLGAPLADARLLIAVKDLPDLAIRTPSGTASPVAAAPFGTPPWPGGWLRIDHPILAGAPLDRLVLRLAWAGLPADESGFAGYYRGYVVDGEGQLFDRVPFDNAAFAVTLAAPVHGWDETRRLPLFGPASLGSMPPVAAAAAPNVFATTFDPAPPLLPERGPLAPESWLAAAASDAGGVAPDHICVTLAAPTEGFGHALHAANVQYATEAIPRGDAPPPARPGWLRRLVRAVLGFPGKLLRKLEGVDMAEPASPDPVPVLLPNPPFQPLLSGISLDYAQTVEADGLRFDQAAPFEAPVPVPIAGSPLFPAGVDSPAVDLCFDGVLPGDKLALLVRLAPDGAAGSAPAYRYRARNGWRPLPSDALPVDESAGLTATGIIRLAIPADAATPLALRLTFPDGAGPLPAIVAVTPDAVAATRCNAPGDGAMLPVPAGTVTKLSGLARAVQPIDTAGGRSREPDTQRRARMAERTRHRGRALTAWDMERLLLADFPELGAVRIFAAGDPALASFDDAVTVVAVCGDGDRLPPQRRGAIATHLAMLASPFARIRVVEPIRVSVDVTARLVLAQPDSGPVRAALVAWLSPLAETALALALADDAGVDSLRAGLVARLRDHPEVMAVESLVVTLDGPDDGWRIPVAGTIEVAGVTACAVAGW